MYIHFLIVSLFAIGILARKLKFRQSGGFGGFGGLHALRLIELA